MSLLSVAELRALVPSGLTDPQLQTVIDREEAWLVARYGPHYVDANTAFAEVRSGGGMLLFVQRPVLSVSSVSESLNLGDTATTLAGSAYHLRAAEGCLTRLPKGTLWGEEVTVTYVPRDDNALRKAVLIDLLRLTLTRTGLKGESVAGEYSYTAADNWDAERVQIARRLGFYNV